MRIENVTKVFDAADGKLIGLAALLDEAGRVLRSRVGRAADRA